MYVMRRNRGFTLIEVLIAIVIFSIGLLGIASLQVAGMRYTHGSQLRAAATMQAESMADLMRANEWGVRNGKYNAFNGMPATFSTDCSTTVCNAEERAVFDLVTWNLETNGQPTQSNAEVLPQGVGMVCRDATPNDGDASNWLCSNTGNVYSIKIQWQERTAGEDDFDSDVKSQVFTMAVVPALDQMP